MTDLYESPEAVFDEAIGKIIENYLAKSNIGYSHRVGGWICRELKKRGQLTVITGREAYLLKSARPYLEATWNDKSRKAVLVRLVEGESVTCNRICRSCKIKCKPLINYRDMLVLYD
jgi:hypothetical protein